MTNDEIKEVNRICDRLLEVESDFIKLTIEHPQFFRNVEVIKGDTIFSSAITQLRMLMPRLIKAESNQEKHISLKRKLKL